MKHYTTRADEVRVRLLKIHTHAGDRLMAGTEITVDAGTADWLEAQGVGQRVTARAKFEPAADAGHYIGNPTTKTRDED